MGGLGAVLGGLGAILGPSWSGLGRCWAVSRDNEAEIDLQGQDEFHQQGQRAKHKHQNPKEETLNRKSTTPDRPPPAAVMLSIKEGQNLRFEIFKTNQNGNEY